VCLCNTVMILIRVVRHYPNSGTRVGAQIRAVRKNGRAEHSDVQAEKGSSFLSCCFAIVMFGGDWMEDEMGWFLWGVHWFQAKAGLVPKWGVSPMMGLKIRTSWKDAGHWLFVRVGIP
jgi:hypothetical protein